MKKLLLLLFVPLVLAAQNPQAIRFPKGLKTDSVFSLNGLSILFRVEPERTVLKLFDDSAVVYTGNTRRFAVVPAGLEIVGTIRAPLEVGTAEATSMAARLGKSLGGVSITYNNPAALFNGYFDGTDIRADITGYVGSLRYILGTGEWAIRGTGASVNQGEVATLSTFFRIDSAGKIKTGVWQATAIDTSYLAGTKAHTQAMSTITGAGSMAFADSTTYHGSATITTIGTLIAPLQVGTAEATSTAARLGKGIGGVSITYNNPAAIFNGYFDGVNTRTDLTGYTGSLLYDMSAGTWSIKGTAASATTGDPIVPANLLVINKSGQITTGVWNGTSISTTYTDAKVASVFGRTGAVAAASTDYAVAGISNTTISGTSTWNGNAIPATYGGTGQTGYTVGDILYASSTTALSALNASTAGKVLTANGAGVQPSWETAPVTSVTETGTGLDISPTTGAVKLRMLKTEIDTVGLLDYFEVDGQASTSMTTRLGKGNGGMGLTYNNPAVLMNGYFDGANTKADAAGYVGSLRYTLSTGDWAIRGTTATVAQNGTATLVDYLTFTNTGLAYFKDTVSVGVLVDRTPSFEGEAIRAVKGIRGVNGEIDHSTLPDFVRASYPAKVVRNGKEVVEYREGRNVGNMVSLLTSAIQEQQAMIHQLQSEITKLKRQ